MVLVKGNVADVCTALHLSRAIFGRIQWNLLWSLLYNCLGIPIAAGVFYPVIHTRLPPAIAALAMALSSISVVSSSLSLRLYKPPDLGSEQRRRRRDRRNHRLGGSGGSSSSNNYSSDSDSGLRGAWTRWRQRQQQQSQQHPGDDDALAADLLQNDHLTIVSSENDQTDSTRCIDNRSAVQREVGGDFDLETGDT